MRLAVGIVVLIACSSSHDREAAARLEADKAASKRGRDAAEVRVGRAQAEAFVSAAGLEQMDVAYKRLDALSAQTDRARDELAAAKTSARKQAAEAKLRALEDETRSVTEAKAAIIPAWEAEKRRLASLPDSCFLRPAPLECHLPKEMVRSPDLDTRAPE